jgi:hypothetical protein
MKMGQVSFLLVFAFLLSACQVEAGIPLSGLSAGTPDGQALIAGQRTTLQVLDTQVAKLPSPAPSLALSRILSPSVTPTPSPLQLVFVSGDLLGPASSELDITVRPGQSSCRV